MSGVIDLTQEDDHAADTEEDEPAQTADVAGGAAAEGPCCGDRCRSCLRCAATAPCHQREPCLCEEAGEQGGRPEEELRRLQQAREEALFKTAIASSLAPAPPSESPADERAYNAQLAEAMRQSVEEARLRQSAEETHWRQTLDVSLCLCLCLCLCLSLSHSFFSPLFLARCSLLRLRSQISFCSGLLPLLPILHQ